MDENTGLHGIVRFEVLVYLESDVDDKKAKEFVENVEVELSHDVKGIHISHTEVVHTMPYEETS